MNKNMKEPKTKIAISIDHSLSQETDLIAQELEIPRSQWVARALKDYNRRYQNQKLLAKINAAYSDEFDSEDIAVLEIIHSHQTKHDEEGEWN